MLSKGSVAVLPVLLLGIIWWQRKADYISRRDLLRTTPFFLIAMVLAVVNMWSQTHGSGAVIRSAGFAERLLGAGGAVWFYLYKALLPFDLAFVYPQWRIDAGNPSWWLPLAAALIVTAVFWRYRESWSRPFLFAWGFFCVALVPVLGFVDVGFMQYSLVADHYQHISLIGVIVPAAVGWNAWHRRSQETGHSSAMIVSIAVVGTLAFLTWRQSAIYSDAITLYQTTLAKNPDCWMAHNNLGLAFAETGRSQEAIKHYKQALSLNPLYRDAFYNLGVVFITLGQYQQAIEYNQKALRLDPNSSAVHNNLGNALIKIDRVQEAREEFLQALRLNPDLLEAHNNLGLILVRENRLPEAIQHYQEALRLNPNYIETYCNLSVAYAIIGQTSDALACAEKGLELARSKGDTRLVKHFENWLNFYRDRLSNQSKTPPPSNTDHPPP